MADIRLAKPAAGTTQTVPSAPDGRFIFDFPADAATLTRNGDDLVLTFDDGAAIQLQGFYTTYSKEEMPSFQVDGVEISGQDFFAALDEDLMPAAGPASGSSAARGGRYNEYGGSDLLDGLDHLGRLDIGFDGGTQLATDTVEPSPYSEVDHGVTVTPSTPGTDPDDPSIPVQGEDFPPTMPHDVLQVDESALDGGSGGGSATAAGSMRVSAPDGVAIITIGGVVVWQNGALTGNPVLTDEGHLDVTGFDGTNLTYTYTLTGSTQEHAKLNAGGENDAIAHEMAVVVTDRDGDSGSAVIRVEITDDVPTIKSFERDVTEGDADPIVGNALEGAVAGADGANFAWTNPDQQGRYGKLTLNEDGTYSYELNNDDPEVKALTDGDTRTEEISYTYTDADGDVAEGKVTITINGVNNGVEVGSGTLTVYEAGLDDGSTPGGGNTPTTASGSLHINAPDGVATIAIGEVTVFENGALTGNTVSTDEGTLTVTGFDEATGELKFTYELTGNTLEHNTDATDKQLSHDLAVTVTDVDGSTDTGVVTVVITDDGPVVTPVETEYKGNKYVNTVSVSFGADNDTGTDSSLAVNAHDVDGTVIEWIKVDDSTSNGTDLSKLSQGESWTNGNIIVSRENGNFVFKIKENGSNAHITVTATDADGDTDTEELNLTAPDAGPNAIIVDEALLTDGNVVNSDNSGHKPSGTGSFTVNLNGEDGTVTLNYGTGENSSITLSLINGETFDKDWLSTNKTLTVNGVVVEVTGATQQDGSWKIEYSYSLTGQQTHTGQGVGENDALSDEIDITVTDATGDTSTGSLTVTVHDDGPVLTDKIDFTVPEGKENYYDNSPEIMFTIGVSPNNTRLEDLEFGADVGEDTASAATLTVKVNGAEFTIQVTRDEDGNLHFSGDNGEGKILFTGPADADKEDSLSYDKETGIFTYTRPAADIGGTTNSYDVSLTITDADGDSDTVSDTYITVFRNPTVTDSTVTTDEGNIIMNDIPIGSGDENDKTSQVENTAQGSITVNLDHADGTITIGDMPITVDKDGNILSVNGNTGGILDGQTIKGTYGYLSNISLVAQGDGTITINYTYTLNAPVNGGTNNVSGRGDSHLADQFTVTVTTQGGTETGTITANALDDAPVLAVSNPESVKDTADTIEIPLEKFSVGADVISLDGKTASISVEVGENEYTFTIIHESNGTYSFIAPNNQDDNLKIESTAEGGYKIVYTRAPQDIADGKDDSYTFGITVTDADGDTATGSVTVCAKVVPPTINESGSKTDLLVDEDGLVHETNSKTDAGQLVVDMHGQAGTVTIGGVQVTVSTEDQVGWAMEPAQGRYGKLTITEATWNDGKLTINYEYTLQTPYTDSDNENGINTVVDADSFQILINGESSGSITVDIVDDVPTLTVENFHGAYGEGIDGTVNFDFGADNGEGTKIELSVNGGEKVAGASTDGKNWTFDVDGQTVTLNAETGEFHYDLPASGSKDTYTFQFTVTDADDDEVSNAAPVTVTVEGTDLSEVKGSVTGDDDNVLTGEAVSVTIPELPAGVTLVANQTVNVTDADGKVYGQLIVDAEGKVTFAQTVAYSGSQHNAQGESEDATGFSGNLTVNLADGTTSSITVDVSILDDIPTISNSDMSTSVILGDSSDNLAKVDEEISFINYKKIDVNDGKPVYEQTSTKVSTTYWNGQITISAAKVTYNGDDERGNPLITAEDTNGMQLLYSSYNGGTKQYYKDNNPPQEDKQNNIAHKDKDGNWYRDAPESDWGLTVGNSKDDGEIKATGDTSDAVVIDLEGYAYGITINFGAFFAGKSSPDDPAAGTGYDNVSEKALITFYKDGKLVYSTVEYGTNSGEFTFNTGDIVLEGFDKVVISAVDNSTPDFPNENSDFTIQGIDFITKRDDPIIINEGKVTAKSGADGFADAYTDSYAKFDLADMVEQNGGELNGDGTSGTITVLKDGTKQRVTLELSEGSSGESILTGTLESGEQLFTATLDKDGNWTMEQYEQFRVPGKQGSNQFELVFKTEDADGDISSTTVNVPLEVVDQTTTGTGVAIGNDNDSIVITGGDGVAGTVAAGDSGLSSRNLADAGDDTITAAGSDSSVIVYGDVMNTDRLLYELKQLEQSNSWVVAGAVVSDLPNYGSGTQVFQWLEANGEKLTGTDYAGWTHADTVDYMLRHADELGYETCVGDTGEFYLVKPDGTVLDMDGTEATVGLDSLTGRGGGDDTITGSKADDVIYGQEGNDLLVGDAPSGSGEGSTVDSIEGTTVASIKGMDSEDLDAFIQSVEGTDADGDDRLFGGTGDDVLLGMGGDDYIDGGAGEDAIFGGRGNDIIVYDSNDYLVSGGSGIDFMVSDDSTLTLTTLLSGGKDGHEGPIVDSIEVLITGKDALSLTSLEQMAKDYGISITGSSLKLNDDLWTQEGNGYRFTGDPDNGSTPDELFMQVNNDTDARVSVELVPSDDIAEAVQRAEIEHSNG